MAGASTDAALQVRTGQLLDEFHCLLSPVIIQVPPLRQRQADLPVLVDRLLQRAGSGADTPVTGLTEPAWDLLRNYAWPGNIGELYAVLASACRRAKGQQLDSNDLPWFLGAAVAKAERTMPLDKLLEQVERRLVQLAMVIAKGNKSRAAQLLEIPRVRLLRRLESMGLTE
jgi:DNA-binding NtrC family response regulator